MITDGSSTSADDVHLPGSKPATPTGMLAKTHAVPKPAPLPPLKGLTVAEIRAMLGVPQLPGSTSASSSTTTSTPAVQAGAAIERYA